MIRLAIVVEGETEEEFVNNLLTPHLRTYGVSATPHPLGGNVTVERLASEMVKVAVFEGLLDCPPNLIQKLDAIRTNVSTPEDINDGKETHPSKRITDLMPSYQKRIVGPYLAELTGLSVIRSACPRFGKWIDSLESLQQRNLHTPVEE